MKVGILGGTFNPIHQGHLILAENSYSELKLDKILFMPSGISYLKNQNEIAEAKHRINMVKLAIANNSHFELSTMEIDRGGNTYTYETLKALKSKNMQDELHFLGGADTLMSIESWKHPETIFNLCTLVISPRDHLERNVLEEKALELKNKYDANIYILNTTDIEISSSAIRNRIKNDITVRYYLPDNVIEYINKNKLYNKG